MRPATRNPKAQRNFSDLDSHILKGVDGWIQAYNTQVTVDGVHQVIVAIGVSNQPNDAVHLLAMVELIQANTSQVGVEALRAFQPPEGARLIPANRVLLVLMPIQGSCWRTLFPAALSDEVRGGLDSIGLNVHGHHIRG